MNSRGRMGLAKQTMRAFRMPPIPAILLLLSLAGAAAGAERVTIFVDGIDPNRTKQLLVRDDTYSGTSMSTPETETVKVPHFPTRGSSYLERSALGDALRNRRDEVESVLWNGDLKDRGAQINAIDDLKGKIRLWNRPVSRFKTVVSATYTQTTLTPTIAILLDFGKKLFPLLLETVKKLIPAA